MAKRDRMIGTSLLLPGGVLERAEKLAKREGVALAVILRRWIDAGIETEDGKAA